MKNNLSQTSYQSLLTTPTVLSSLHKAKNLCKTSKIKKPTSQPTPESFKIP